MTRWAREAMARVLLLCITVYRMAISPLLPSACRFSPSCSEYMQQALEQHGVWSGSRLGLRRLLRCHPLHPGGYDPVP